MSASPAVQQRGFKGGFRQSMSWLHTWSGLALGVLLYFIFVTGTLGYFNAEIDRWMRPELQPAPALPQAEQVQRAVALAQTLEPRAHEWWIALPQGRHREQLTLSMQAPGAADGAEGPWRDERLDPATGAPRQTLVRRTGGGDALYVMHYALHYMPSQAALYLVGIATMFMLLAIVTGVVVHKRIFADLFTFRPGKGQRSWLDAHNLTSVLALPYMVMITYSGLVFYTYEYMPSVKLALYGHDETAGRRYDEEAGTLAPTPQRVGRAAPLAPIGPMLAQAERAWGAERIAFVSISHPGDAGARVRIERTARDAVARHGSSLVFDGVTGALLHSLRPSANPVQTFSDAMLALHEGHFAAPPLRWLYFLTGALGAAMVATGLVVWTTKRRQRVGRHGAAGAGLRFVERLNVGTVAGLLIGIGAYFWANRVLPVEMDTRAAWELHALFIAWALALLHGLARPPASAWRVQLNVGAALFALLPVLNAITTDVHLGRTLPLHGQPGDWARAGFDLTALAFGVALAGIAARLRRHVGAPQAAVIAPDASAPHVDDQPA
jgi:uncharacterized iron-regulated membrane protein